MMYNNCTPLRAGQHPPRPPYGPISYSELRPKLELPKPCRYYDSTFSDESEVQCQLGKDCKFLHICSNVEGGNREFCYKCRGKLRHTPTPREMTKLARCCFETAYDPLNALRLYKTIMGKFVSPNLPLNVSYHRTSTLSLSSLGISSKPSKIAVFEPKPCKRHDTKPCVEISCPMFGFQGDVMWCIRKMSANQKPKNQWESLSESTTAQLEVQYSDPHNKEASFNWNGGKYKVLFHDHGPLGEFSSEIEFLRLYYEDPLTQQWTWYWEEDLKDIFSGTAFPKLLKEFYNFEDKVTKWVAYGKLGSNRQSSSIDSKHLENLRNLTSSFSSKCDKLKTFTAGSQSYTVDLQNFTQVNLNTGKVRSICRRPNLANYKREDSVRPADLSIRFPSWFSDALNGPIRKKLTNDSVELQTLKRFVELRIPNAESVKIFQIENHFLWKKYYFTRQEMRSNKFKEGGLNEALLFHGTSADSVNKIVEQNFDCRLSGSRVGELLGAGAYFTPSFETAVKYAGQGREKFIFIALVLVGDFTLGKKEYRRPPENPKGGLYDSCVDKLQKPDKFAIFDNSQCYPLYCLKIKQQQSILKKL